MAEKHKHCEVIKAWAEGAVIEFKRPYGTEWEIVSNPSWVTTNKYRVKPKEKKKYYKYAFKSSTGDDCISRFKYVSDSEFVDECAITPKFYTRLDWTMEEREVND